MAWVRKRGRKWYLHWLDDAGEPQSKVSGARGKMEAQNLADDLERKCERVRLGLDKPTRPDIAYRAGVALYLASLGAEYVTKKNLEGLFRLRILPHLGGIMCRAVTPADVKRALSATTLGNVSPEDMRPHRKAHWTAADYAAAQTRALTRLRPNGSKSPQTREHVRVAIQGSFTFLIEHEKAVEGDNPAAIIGKVDIPKKKSKHLELAEIPRLMNAVPESRRFNFIWNVGTASRKGEAFGLRREDVHVERNMAYIERSHDRDTTKGGKGRPVPIPDWLVPLLRAHLASHSSPWVFPDAKGQRQKKSVKMHLIMKTALRRAGLVSGYVARCVTKGRRKKCGFQEERAEPGSPICPGCGRKLLVKGTPIAFNFKDLRSTFGTWAYAQTRDIRYVQQVLGHSDVRTTEERYAHVLDEHFLARANQVQLLPALGSLLAVEKGKAVPQGALLGNQETGKA